ncbi:MAG: hypothetical protein WBM69_01355 [Desulfobacterales bacterium]
MLHQTTLKTKRNVTLLALSQAVLITGTSLLLAFSSAFFLSMPKPGAAARSAGGRPLAKIVRQPAYLVAVASAMVGYGVMNFIMIATPLAMHDFAHPFSDTAFVIQWHVFGTVTLTSLGSGAVQNILGWETINMAVIPFLALIALANL